MQKTRIIINKDYLKNCTNSFYDFYYQNPKEEMIAWRDFGAIEKYNSIRIVTQNNRPRNVIEFGCGLCSILKIMEKNNFCTEMYGLEVSPSAIKYIESNISLPHLRAVYLDDSLHTQFSNKQFDLGILSHVVEHLPEPETVIKEALRVCNNVLIEVPLEVNVVSNLFNFIKRHDRKKNEIGHIQFFTKKSFRKLINQSGGIILRDRVYRSPVSYKKNTIVQIKDKVFWAIFTISGSYIVETHYAVLVTDMNKK